MSPSPDSEHTAPVSNLTYLHRQQRSRAKVQDTPHPRGRDTSRYELGRRDRNVERVTRIYPRDMYVAALSHPAALAVPPLLHSANTADYRTEQTPRPLPIASRQPPLRYQRLIMQPRLRCCPPWALREAPLRNIPTSGPSPCHSSQIKPRPTTGA